MFALRHLLLLVTLLSAAATRAQSVGIGTATPSASAALEVQSTSKGLLLPRLTTEQMNLIGGAVPGLLVFNTTANAFYGYRSASTAANISQLQSTNSGTSTRVGQSFTATANATLNSIAVYIGVLSAVAVTENVTIRLYDSSGPTPGTEITSVTQALALSSSSTSLPSTFTFPPGVVLVPGRTYTFMLSSSGGSLYSSFHSSPNLNLYDGGHRFTSSTPITNQDMKFRVNYTVTGEWVPLN